MKKILLFLTITVMATSCADVTQMSYRSQYQRQNLGKFGKKRGYQKGSANYVRPKKRGSIMDPTVKKDTRKVLIQSNR